MALITARHHDSCVTCGGRIEPGDVVTYGEYGIMHPECGPPPPPEICEICFMTKANNGTCGCDL